MQSTKHTTNLIQAKLLKVILVLGVLISGILVPTVSAAPIDSQAPDPVLTHCRAEVPQRARAACENSENIRKAKNAASYEKECENAPASQREACVTKYANNYIDAAVADNPKNPDDFTKKLQAVASKVVKGDNDKLNKRNPNNKDDKVDTGCQSNCIGAFSLPRTPSNAIESILNFLLNIAGALALLMIVVSGLRYVFASGDSQRISKAKNGIIFALVGLILVIIARAIVAFVVDRL